uniref:CBL-interacting protein kinase 32-like isoform X3 n=1 Tax=Rhizophora mucronata TaxID=61149 RepID=A0A2P2IJC6_RHIMU
MCFNRSEGRLQQ